jgi:hypothetical protein
MGRHSLKVSDSVFVDSTTLIYQFGSHPSFGMDDLTIEAVDVRSADAVMLVAHLDDGFVGAGGGIKFTMLMWGDGFFSSSGATPPFRGSAWRRAGGATALHFTGW